ncbi:Sec20-domain-containing protein [Hyaloraphidium curvatum]|nr:Sec20-domain-containing protein [Hyaloraphidium curvatum]
MSTAAATKAPPPLPPEVCSHLDALARAELDIRGATSALAETAHFSTRDLQDAQNHVRSKLKMCQAALNDIVYHADDFPLDVRSAILEEARTHKDRHTQLQADIRTATLAAAAALRKREEDDRQALLSGALTVEDLRRRRPQNDTVLDTSNQLTDAMRSAVQMLSTEVERSAQANLVLDESTQTLGKTTGEYRTYGSLMRTSRELVSRIASRDWTDRLLIFFGLLVFLLTVLYILRRRAWFVPSFSWIWWLFTWPFRIFSMS